MLISSSFFGNGILRPLLGQHVLQPLRVLATQRESVQRYVVFLTNVCYRYRDIVGARVDQLWAVVPEVKVHFKYGSIVGTLRCSGGSHRDKRHLGVPDDASRRPSPGLNCGEHEQAALGAAAMLARALGID
ncbi:MAG: hypothetical protein JSV78_05670 [Phycisphaerales bacterium]|nr:MAG: hypothetical protein JSV78_05670 [Phycisphaerales bacterium]